MTTVNETGEVAGSVVDLVAGLLARIAELERQFAEERASRVAAIQAAVERATADIRVRSEAELRQHVQRAERRAAAIERQRQARERETLAAVAGLGGRIRAG